MNYVQYLKTAFLSQINLVCVAGAALFSLVTWNWIPAIFGGICESIYLVIVPVLPWYHRRIEQKKILEQQEIREQEIKKLLFSLPQKDRDQYQSLTKTCDEIKKNYQTLHPETQNFLDQITLQLDRLTARYLRMRQAFVQSEEYLSATRSQDLKNKLDGIRSELMKSEGQIRDVQEKQKTILEKRLEKRAQVENNNHVLRTQLDTIEQFILLMKDQSLTLRDPDEVTGQIDSMMNEVENTESTVKELESFFKENE